MESLHVEVEAALGQCGGFGQQELPIQTELRKFIISQGKKCKARWAPDVIPQDFILADSHNHLTQPSFSPESDRLHHSHAHV